MVGIEKSNWNNYKNNCLGQFHLRILIAIIFQPTSATFI